METSSQEYIGFWLRLWASVIDTLWLTIIIFPLLFLVYGKDYLSLPSAQIGFWYYLFVWILPAVAIILFWFFRESTPGKMLIGAKIIDNETRGKLQGWQLVIRYLGYFISAIALGLGFVWIAVDDKKQGWHDKLANTVVVSVVADRAKFKLRLVISLIAVFIFALVSYFVLLNIVNSQLISAHDVTTGQYIAEGFEYGRNVSTTECWNQSLRRVQICDNLRCKINQSYFLKACMGASYATSRQYG